MKICAYNAQTDELMGCIEYDGSAFTYDPPSMEGWEVKYVEKYGADAALENMVGATNGYWYIEEAKEGADA